MLINNTNRVNFGRAFSTLEKREYKKMQADALNELGNKETSAVIFDFNVPSQKGMNYGIGTLNSKASLPFVNFLKDVSNISKIQAAPQSELAYFSDGKTFKPVTSPYSGSTFTLGRHTISLEKLANKEYASILSSDYVKNAADFLTNMDKEYKTDYSYVLGENRDGIIFKALKTAYSNFNAKLEAGNPEALALDGEFLDFKQNMSDDMKKDIMFEVLSDYYHSKGVNGCDISNWDIKDKNLYADDSDPKYILKRQNDFKKEIEFLNFCQFLAFKQHKETKENLNSEGVQLFGDCLVCFSNKEVWANPECFLSGWFTGGKDPFCPETNGIQPWGSPALNYALLGEYDKDGNIVKLGKTGELLYRKFKNFMELYDGVRMDAFWQYVSPFLYNNLLESIDVQGVEDKILKIMEKAANDASGSKFTPDKFVLELIGFNTERGKELTINRFPHVYSTAYAEYDENPVDLIKSKGYKNGYFIIGATSHDNDSLVNMSRDLEKRKLHKPILNSNLKEGIKHLGYKSENYINKSNKEKQEQDFRTAKVAEIFLSDKQYYTLPDLFGMSERINISGKSDKNNWSVRIPNDYERFYYTQLSKGYGINFPKSYEVALYAKESKNIRLLNKLNEAAEILASNGPMTEMEANLAEKSNKLGTTFNYSA